MDQPTQTKPEDAANSVLELARWNDQVARRARSPSGRRAALASVPVADLERARELLAQAREALALARGRRVPRRLAEDDGVDLLERPRTRGAPLFAHELAVVFRFLKHARELRRELVALDDAPALAAIGRGIPDLATLVDAFERAVDERGQLMDSASERLRQIRLEIGELKERARKNIERIAARPDVRPLLRAPHPSLRDGRFVLAVKAEARGRIRGLYHDRSGTGATAYVEPEEVVDDQNKLRDRAIDEQREVARILWELTRLALDREDELVRARDAVATFDLAVARATVADELSLAEPALEAGGALELVDVRHPLLLALAFDRATGTEAERRAQAIEHVVPFTLGLGERFDVVVLTGPNTGGKTATLKAVGLTALLARTGNFVPAVSARVPLFPGVFADIGDEQDLAQNLSTFSAHVRRIAAILAHATRGSLVLIDELGTGTDPLEGEALSLALLDFLLDRGVIALVTTHLGRLKEFAGRRPRAMNASMQFDPETLRPTYRLILGIPGASNALKIAQNLGLPAPLLEHAEKNLAETEPGHGRLFEELDRARATVERLKTDAARDRNTAQQIRSDLESEAKDAAAKRAALEAHAEVAAERRLERLAAELEEPRRVLLTLGGRAAVAAGAMLEAIRRALEKAPLAEQRRRFAKDLKPGDVVHLPRYNELCRVRRVLKKEGKIEVDYRSMSVTVGFDEVAPSEAAHLFRPPRSS